MPSPRRSRELTYDEIMAEAKAPLGEGTPWDGGSVPFDDPKEPSFVDRLKKIGTSVRDYSLPTDTLSDVWEGPKHAITHPIDSAKLVGKGMWDSQMEQFDKAGEADSWSEKAGHYAAGALPLVGPAAASLGEAGGRGDWEEMVGGATGLIGSLLLGSKAARGKTGNRPRINTEHPVVKQGQFSRAAGAADAWNADPTPPAAPARPSRMPNDLFDTPDFRGAGEASAPADTAWSRSSAGPKPESPLPSEFAELNAILNAPDPVYGPRPAGPNEGGRLVSGGERVSTPPNTNPVTSISEGLASSREPQPIAPEAWGDWGGAEKDMPTLVPDATGSHVAAPEMGTSVPEMGTPKPRLTAEETGGLFRGREKFAESYPDATPAPGMLDDLDRTGVEYGRSQRELKRLLGMDDADPVDVGRMRIAAREGGSRLRSGAKEAGTHVDPMIDDIENFGRTPEPDMAAVDARSQELADTLPRRRVVEGEVIPDAPEQRALPEYVPEPEAAPTPTSSTIEPSFLFGKRAGLNEKGEVPFQEMLQSELTPAQRKSVGAYIQSHQAGSLLASPMTVPKIGVSNVMSALQKASESAAKQRSMTPLKNILREFLNVKQLGKDAIEAFKHPDTKHTRLDTGLSEAERPATPFGWASRAVGAIDTPFRNAMKRAGFSDENALTVTQQRHPITDTGKAAVAFQQRNPTTRGAIPFLKSAVNQFETGMVEPLQSANRVRKGTADAGDAVKIASAAGTGAAAYAGSDYIDELPWWLRPTALAAGGLYAAPAAIGYAGAKADDFTDWLKAGERAVPLGEGVLPPVTTSKNFIKSMMGRVIPRALNPDYWTGTERETDGLLEEIQAAIPGLAQLLRVKVKRAPRAKTAPQATRSR